jgi:hypothetical protein
MLQVSANEFGCRRASARQATKMRVVAATATTDEAAGVELQYRLTIQDYYSYRCIPFSFHPFLLLLIIIKGSAVCWIRFVSPVADFYSSLVLQNDLHKS